MSSSSTNKIALFSLDDDGVPATKKKKKLFKFNYIYKGTKGT